MLLISFAAVGLFVLAKQITAQQFTPPQTRPAENATFALEGTELLKLPVSTNIREEQRQQIIRYFLTQIAATPAKRDSRWQPNFSSLDSYKASVQGHRADLRAMLGLIQPRHGTPNIKVLGEERNLSLEEVTLPINSGFSVRALLFLPHSSPPAAAIIAIPPATESREEFAGIVQGMMPAKWLRTLLAHNIAVAVPLMVERSDDNPLCRQAGYKDRRRILWRAAFIVGRTLVGVEVQEVLALREFLASQGNIVPGKIAVLGEGQGGMTALYAGAMDEGLASVASIDYFEQREKCWKGPVDQVLYGQLNEFGDAEVAALIAPRSLLIVHSSKGPIPAASVAAEFARARRFYGGLDKLGVLTDLEVQNDPLNATASKIASALGSTAVQDLPELTFRIPRQEVDQARNEQFEALLKYLRGLCEWSDQVRAEYWQLNSTLPADRVQKVQKLHAELANLEGVISSVNVPMHPRTALLGETDKFLAYDVFLDLVPGVEVYGQLLVPRPIAGHMESRHAAVVCQHGFDGAPKYVSGVGTELETNDHFYHRFGQRLAERGYVVFAPYMAVPAYHPPAGGPGANSRNPAGLGDVVQRADLINPLVRLAAPLGMMRTSIELAKLHRVVDFLQSLRFVDADRIGFYGLSYGGYAAIWMPPLEPRLKVTVISAFFNDWPTMLTDTTRFGSSYWSLPDEDFYNWNVLNRFSHTELIAAMWPRPVCIEYGSEDPVTTPVWHNRAWEQVKAWRDSWEMDDKIRDDDFIGPHTIHGIGTFSFLDQWLRRERRAGRDYGCRDYNYCNQSVAPGFHGYSQSSKNSVPYSTQVLDSHPSSVIYGRFYIPIGSPVLTGMAFKLTRTGNPGDLLVKFGSTESSADLGVATIHSRDVYPVYDLWYEAMLDKPLRLDPSKTYYFEIETQSGLAPSDSYTVFGPMPLGGRDFPPNFGMSFRTSVRKDERQ
jgi:dienelactone hydrolase